MYAEREGPLGRQATPLGPPSSRPSEGVRGGASEAWEAAQLFLCDTRCPMQTGLPGQSAPGKRPDVGPRDLSSPQLTTALETRCPPTSGILTATSAAPRETAGLSTSPAGVPALPRPSSPQWPRPALPLSTPLPLGQATGGTPPALVGQAHRPSPKSRLSSGSCCAT